MTKDEALKLALEALETLAHYENPETKIQNRKKDGGSIVTIYPHKVASDAATALRQALEQQPTDEPAFWYYTLVVAGEIVNERFTAVNWDTKFEPFGRRGVHHGGDVTKEPLYTRPQPAAWIGMTNEEIDKAWRSCDYTVPWEQHRIDIARAIEAKLKEKNQ